MEPTVAIAGEARAFWDRHAVRLAAAGILTPADIDAFVVLCQTWERVQVLAAFEASPEFFRVAIQYTNAVKQFERLARQFAILPRDRRAAKMTVEPPAKKDEFGL